MRFHELFENELLEMPMPADWDKSVFTPKTSYAKRIKYAAERAAKLGRGSSRSAFLITIDGKESILKVAHNVKGLAQNEVEVGILADHYAKSLDIMIPLIDYDQEHERPLWINVERAQKVSQIALCKILKCEELSQIVIFAAAMIGQMKPYGGVDPITKAVSDKFGETGLETFEEYAEKLAELGSSYDVQLRDFSSAGNWGLYNGHPVVIDVGLNSEVDSSHYSRRR